MKTMDSSLAACQGRSSRAKAVLLHQVLMETGPWCSFSLYNSSLCFLLERSTYHIQASGNLIFETLPRVSKMRRPCTGIQAELYFSTFKANHALLLFSIFNLNLECICGTEEQQRIPSQIFPKRHDCRSCYSQQEMHGKPLRAVFDFSKTH